MLLVATLLALMPLVLVLYYLLKRGLGAWSIDFFTTDPTGNFFGDPGGVKSALLGTIEMVGLARRSRSRSASAWRSTSSSTARTAASPRRCATSST